MRPAINSTTPLKYELTIEEYNKARKSTDAPRSVDVNHDGKLTSIDSFVGISNSNNIEHLIGLGRACELVGKNRGMPQVKFRISSEAQTLLNSKIATDALPEFAMTESVNPSRVETALGERLDVWEAAVQSYTPLFSAGVYDKSAEQCAMNKEIHLGVTPDKKGITITGVDGNGPITEAPVIIK